MPFAVYAAVRRPDAAVRWRARAPAADRRDSGLRRRLRPDPASRARLLAVRATGLRFRPGDQRPDGEASQRGALLPAVLLWPALHACRRAVGRRSLLLVGRP